MQFPADHPRGPNGGPIFLGEELCPICECCSFSSVPCEQCDGDGVWGHDCGEDTCCCLDPEENESCHICEGNGGFMTCLGGCDFDKRERHKPIEERQAAGAVDPQGERVTE